MNGRKKQMNAVLKNTSRSFKNKTCPTLIGKFETLCQIFGSVWDITLQPLEVIQYLLQPVIINQMPLLRL